MMKKKWVTGRIANRIRMVELGMPNWEKYASSNPLLKERKAIPARDDEITIMCIANFVSESVTNVFSEMLCKSQGLTVNIR